MNIQDKRESYEFVYDERLDLPLPVLYCEWEEYPQAVQERILLEWEEIRGKIPERILRLERIIIAKQAQLDEEEHFATACRLNWEIAELASRINDLHLWFRANQEIHASSAHH
jgi:hypothetical protein